MIPRVRMARKRLAIAREREHSAERHRERVYAEDKDNWRLYLWSYRRAERLEKAYTDRIRASERGKDRIA